MGRYRLYTRDTQTADWEPGEIILTGEELETALRNLLRTAPLVGFQFRGGPVFVQELGPDELMYISFEEIK